MTPLREVAGLFLRMGVTAFGGPVAHIAMFRDEVVTRRQWLTDDEFMDLLGATQLIPGPNSTEMAIHIGYHRAGWRGLLVAGACFILPSAFIVGVLAWLYVQYGTTPTAVWLLYGVKPIIIGVILYAIWGLRRVAVKGALEALLFVAVLVLYLLGVNELALLFGGGAAFLLARLALRWRDTRQRLGAPLPFGALYVPSHVLVQVATVTPFALDTLFLTFLKIGSVLYGSGYVLLAFLRGDFVERLGWLTQQQLLDAVAIGQFTPGPVFTTATFIGYLLDGAGGAIVSTLGIFLPSFVFVALSSPFIPRLRKSALLSGLLDGVNVASLGLMTAVTLTLAQDALKDGVTVALAVASSVLFVRYKVNSTWLILAGGLIGVLGGVVTGGF
jgi:chromate transporter